MGYELQHHGTKGMHWGVRRYQNPDGSLTPLGRIHYGAAEYDKKTQTAYKNRHSAKTYGDYKQYQRDHYANVAAKLLMRGGEAEKYANNVKNGKSKVSSFISGYANSYVKDAAVYSLAAAGAATAGTLLAGPYGGYIATYGAVYGIDAGKKIARVYRSGKYAFGK